MENQEIKILNVDDVLPNRFQPRIQFDEKAINELAESIKIHGVIQPIVVRKISDKYEIIAGERRYKASVLAGKTTIPAIITTLDDRESAEIALIENVQRQNLTPIEEAISYKKILDMGYLNQISLGEKLGKTQSTIANKLRLLNLTEEAQEALMEGKISERHARSLLRLKNDLQIIMLNRIINERLTVRKTDEEIEKLLMESTDNSSEEKKLEMSDVMNNDMFKSMGIPTEPIVEEDLETKSTEPTIETIEFDLPEEPVNNESININSVEPIKEETQTEMPFKEINPGFMDIDKIEQQASDIYQAPELADLNKLMDTSNNPEIEAPVSPMQEVPTSTNETYNPVPGGGKFFTMFQTEEDTNPNFVKDLESKEVNMDFEEPKIRETFDFGVQQPVMQQANLNNETSYSEVQSNDEVKLQPDKVFTMTKPTEPKDTNLDFTHTFTPFSLNDEDSFTKEESEPIAPVQTYQAPEPVTFDEMGEIKVQLPEQQKLATADLKTVINTIRECAATIERFGFTIDTEEIDFEDSYQVTFKIDKI